MGTESRSTQVVGRDVWKQTQVSKAGVPTVTMTDVSAYHKTQNFSRVSVTTPGYPRVGPQGLPMNFFGYSEINTTKLLGWWRSDFSVSSFGGLSQSFIERTGMIYNTHLENHLDFSSVEETNQNNSVKTSLQMRLKDQKVNFAQFVGEREQLTRMLLTNIKRIRAAVRALRAGNFAGAASALGLKIPSQGHEFLKQFRRNQQQAIASGWLELQYGWLPLLSDIFGAIKIFNDRNIVKPPVIVVRCRKSFSNSLTIKREATNTATTILKEVRRDVTVICYYSSSQQFLKTTAELGLLNPIFLAWELLPFSFVADWFAHIGNFLSSFDASVGTEFQKGCTTTFKKQKLRYIVVGKGIKTTPPGDLHYNCESGFCEAHDEKVSVQRSGLTANPLPTFPVFRDPLTELHFANALALLSQSFRK